MKLLAFDTSSEVLSLALFDSKKKIASVESEGFTRHSSILVPDIEKILTKAKVKPESIGVIAVGLGPGSFTGLRVGVTTAKVMAYALKTKIVGVPSLDAVALGLPDGVFTVAMDARRGKFFTAGYEKKGGSFRTVSKLRLTDANKMGRLKKVIYVGTGTPYFPKADLVARIAFGEIQKKKFTDPFKLEPLYLYPRDCNVTKSKK